MLQRDGAAYRQIGQAGTIDDFLAVEHYRHAVTFQCNQERIPLAERPVRILNRNAGSANFRWQAVVCAVTVDLAGTEFLAPDVHLTLAAPAEIQPAVARIKPRTRDAFTGVVPFHQEVAVVEYELRPKRCGCEHGGSDGRVR